MTRVRAIPRRSIRNELLSLAAVLSVPAAIWLAFPRGAVSFVPSRDGPPRRSPCAFVELDEEQVAAATEKAHAVWSVGAGSSRRIRMDLSADMLPEDRPRPVMDISARTRVAPAGRIRLDIPPMPPSLAAPAPARIASADPGDAGLSPARRELLRREWSGDMSPPH